MWKFYLIQVWTCGLNMSFAKDPHLMLLLHVTVRRTRSLGAHKYKPGQSKSCLIHFLSLDTSQEWHMKKLGCGSRKLVNQAWPLPPNPCSGQGVQGGSCPRPGPAGWAKSVLTLDVDGD